MMERDLTYETPATSLEEQHHAAYGAHTTICQSTKDDVNAIKSNDPTYIKFVLGHRDVECFSDLAWELLGRYISENDNLEDINLSPLGLADEKLCLLFQHLDRASSLQTLNLEQNTIGSKGVAAMVPFLKNSLNLMELNIGYNLRFGSHGFRTVVEALHGGSIENLHVDRCNIHEIAVLEQCHLPLLKKLNLGSNSVRIIPSLEKYTNLQELILDWNDIGKDGCTSIANLLRNRSSSLRKLGVIHNDINDEGAEIIASSLKENGSLTCLNLEYNEFGRRGCRAFLELLNDASCVGATYRSNHTLEIITLPHVVNLNNDSVENDDEDSRKLKTAIYAAAEINSECSAAGNAGRTKVLETQLHSAKRTELRRLLRRTPQDHPHGRRQHPTSQNAETHSNESLFAEIDPILLPNILSCVAKTHGHNELYVMLLATVPYLSSVVNRVAVIRELLSENATQIARLNETYARESAALTRVHLEKTEVLTAETLRLRRELRMMTAMATRTATTTGAMEGKSGAKATETGLRKSRGMVDGNEVAENSLCGRKRRRRSASF